MNHQIDHRSLFPNNKKDFMLVCKWLHKDSSLQIDIERDCKREILETIDLINQWHDAFAAFGRKRKYELIC